MVAALFTRRAVPALARQTRALPRGSRGVHIENNVETALPFQQGRKRKVPLAIGVTAFLSFGFSLPFLAAKWQISKAGG